MFVTGRSDAGGARLGGEANEGAGIGGATAATGAAPTRGAVSVDVPARAGAAGGSRGTVGAATDGGTGGGICADADAGAGAGDEAAGGPDEGAPRLEAVMP